MQDGSTVADFSQSGRRAFIDKNAALLGLSWESLPQLPAWGPMFGYNDEWHHAIIVESVAKASVLMNRRLEPTERDSFAAIMAQNNASLAYAPVVWVPTAVAYERLGRSRFRFPFYTPKSIDPYRFPTQRVAFITGQPAVWGWHATRMTAYLVMSKIALSPLVAAYVTYRTYTTLLAEPNLKTFNADMKNVNQREAHVVLRQMGQRLEKIYGEPEDPSMRDSSSPYFGQQQDEQQQQQQSPETGMVRRSAWDMYRRPAPGRQTPQTGGQPEQEPQEQQEQQEQQSYGYSQPSQTRSQPEYSPASDVGDDDSPFDDASPVAPAARQQPGNYSTSAPSGGSSWDRIRQGAQAEAKPQPGGSQSWAQRRYQATQQASGQQGNDAYSYSDEDRDKSLPKAQAQKDFDAMVEKERSGESEDGRRRR